MHTAAFCVVALVAAGAPSPALAQFAGAATVADGSSCTAGYFAWPDPSGRALICVGGVYQAVSTSSQWITSGSNIYYSGGNVGIGTASPGAKLDVEGTGLVSIFSSSTDVTTSSVGNFQALADSSELFMASHASARTASRYGLTLGGWTEISAFNNTGTTNGLVIGATTAKPLVFGTNSAERMRIDSSGNVGIGTPSPSQLLSVWGSSAWSGNTGLASITDSGTIGAGLSVISTGTGGRNYAIYSSASGASIGAGNFAIYDGTAGANRLVINSSGNVGIGTTGPAYLLHVGSAAASGTVAEFQNSSGNCTFTPTTSTWSCSSDARLKKDIVDTVSALPWIGDMRIRDFTLKATGERKTGVIAQEMLTKTPDMVHLGKDGFYTVDDPNPWKLVKAIQELKSDNDELRKIVAREEAEIADLRREVRAQ